jgi:microcystin-dependent protein
MLKKSFKIRSVKSIGMLLSASALVMGLGISTPTQASEPFLGQIDTFGFNFPPRGWAFCDGQLLSISSYTALFSLLGTTFGGDGRVTFGLPDLRGRVAVHPGQGPGLTNVRWGERGGVETRTLTVSNMPAHNHAAFLQATDTLGNTTDPDGNIQAVKNRTNIYSTAVPNVTMNAASVTVANSGGSQAFSVRDPYLGIYHSIALMGIYPSRN